MQTKGIGTEDAIHGDRVQWTTWEELTGDICRKCDGWRVNMFNWSDDEKCNCGEQE